MIVHVPISIINFSVISNLTQHFLLNSFFFLNDIIFFPFNILKKSHANSLLGIGKTSVTDILTLVNYICGAFNQMFSHPFP